MYFANCRCDETKNFEADDRGACVCKEGHVLNKETEVCERPRSGASLNGVWMLYLALFVIMAVVISVIIQIKRTGYSRRLLDAQRHRM